jgi:Rps23 Pro-64 3,4-dihydroxylase Tpa1-like proline 4-hydroxylase
MNTNESPVVLSDVLFDDERLISNDEREFLAELLRRSENNPNESNPEITGAIARIAGEIVVRRAGGLLESRILQRLVDPNYDQRHPDKKRQEPASTNRTRKSLGQTSLVDDPEPFISSLPPKPPKPTPPSPGPGPGMYTKVSPEGILNPATFDDSGLLPPKCVVFEEFLAPAELEELLSYTLSHQENFVVSEVISPGVNSSSGSDFDYRRSRVLMDLGPHQERLVNRLRSALPRILTRLGIEPFPISRFEAQITASNEGDFFRWHSDNGQKEVAGRQVTFVYFFHREPKMFEGGELRIQGPTWNTLPDGSANYYTIIPRTNQMVLFDSSLTHEIAPVKCPSGKFDASRFTVNGWISR